MKRIGPTFPSSAPLHLTFPHQPPSRSAIHPIDSFILKRLHDAQLTLSPRADSQTLLRRLALDLTGLPPTLEELERFGKEDSEETYQQAVEHYLNSPHYGEKMAQPWLDAVRYADTVGYHGDQNQNIFPYRDYVIRSFNEDKSFDHFTKEQIAGDFLYEANPENLDALIASGFNRLNMMSREGGAQPEEYLAKYAADRVRTLGVAWLGSTLACNECHDHKFDPFSIRDFYQFAAFFSDIKQWGVYADYSYTPAEDPEIKGMNNDWPFLPEKTIFSPEVRQRLTRLEQSAYQSLDRFETPHPSDIAWVTWKKQRKEELQSKSDEPNRGWTSLTPQNPKLIEAQKSQVHLEGHALRIEGPKSSQKPEKYQVELPFQGWISSLRLAIPKPDFSRDSSGIQLSIKALYQGKAQAISHAWASHQAPRYQMGLAKLDVHQQWRIEPAHFQSSESGVYADYLFDAPLYSEPPTHLVLEISTSNLSTLLFYRSVYRPWHASETTIPENDETKEYLKSTVKDTELHYLRSRMIQLRNAQWPTMITERRPEPRVTRVLPRGDWTDRSGAVVQPNFPSFLKPNVPPQERRLTRLDLADWLTSPENPLTARLYVNRLWKQFFGTGLSRVLDDLGLQGEYPSHPELLDWLASEFIQSGWKTKPIIRHIVTSETYRQRSLEEPSHDEQDTLRDPELRLLSKQVPRRLESENIRDHVLAVSGILNPEIGGTSCHPYQPEGYYVNLNFPQRDYHASKDDQQWRRGLYMHRQRTFLHPMLQNFDAPSREECLGERAQSNTPQQALTLLNDPTFVESSRHFAAKLIQSHPASLDQDPPSLQDVLDQRLREVFLKTLSREPSAEEKQSLFEFFQTQHAYFKEHPEEAEALQKNGIFQIPDLFKNQESMIELAAWTQVCRVILNLHETITRY